LTGNLVLFELVDDAMCNIAEIRCCEGQDRRAGSGKANPEQPRLAPRVHELQDFCETWDQVFSVWLMNFILHCEVDHVWI
jgi:hypothetical protein